MNACVHNTWKSSSRLIIHMTPRLINVGLLITSLICYLEWGGGNSGFLFQMELELFQQDDLSHSLTHVMVLAPLAGQAVLLFTLFQKIPGRRLTAMGVGLLSVLVLMIFLIGILSLNYRIFLSTLPFVTSIVLFIRKKSLYRWHVYESINNRSYELQVSRSSPLLNVLVAKYENS